MAARSRATGRSGHPHHPRPDQARAASSPAPSGGPTSGDIAAHRTRLRAVIEPVAARGGYDLEDLTLVRMGRRYVVRVAVDRDGGVGLDAVAELARAISAALDDDEAAGGEFIAGEYQLEVSSPGVDRPLTAPRHWRRNTGRLVTVKLGTAGGSPADGKAVTGRIVAADDAGVTLSVDGVERTHPYAEVGSGRIEVEFSRLDEIDDEDMTVFDGDEEDDTGEDDDADGEPDDDEDEEDAR